MQTDLENAVLKERVVWESVVVSTQGPNTLVFQLKVDEIPLPLGCPFSVYEHGEPLGENRPEKVILVVGATGTGKTTFINSLLNYAYGVEFEDNFRLRLVEEALNEDQSHSQTKQVTVYRIHHQEGFKIPYPLTIIDTPGFGDTEGFLRDKNVAEQLHDFFRADFDIVDHIDAVGFVAQASLPRLTPSQMYNFDMILSVFGTDIEKNIFPVLTFADSQTPEILASIEAANIPYSSYFKFNNSAVLTGIDSEESDYENNDFNRMYWKLCMKNFKKLTKVVGETTPRHLWLTKEVVRQRQIMELYADGLTAQVRDGLEILEDLQQELSLQQEGNSDMRRCTAMKKEFEGIQNQISLAECEIQECLSILREIALKPCSLSTVAYIEMQVQNERAEAKPGWQGRVDVLMRVQEGAVHLMNIATYDFNPFQEFSETLELIGLVADD